MLIRFSLPLLLVGEQALNFCKAPRDEILIHKVEVLVFIRLFDMLLL